MTRLIRGEWYITKALAVVPFCVFAHVRLAIRPLKKSETGETVHEEAIIRAKPSEGYVAKDVRALPLATNKIFLPKLCIYDYFIARELRIFIYIFAQIVLLETFNSTVKSATPCNA